MSIALFVIAACAAPQPPQPKDETKELARTLEISKVLKAMSDEEWNGIAGSKVSERFTIAKGDTLLIT